MPTLHLVRQSGFSTSDFKQCTQTTGKNDVIVFMDDGCYCLSHKLFAEIRSNQDKNITFYAIEEHVKARAISHSYCAELILMDKLVSLTFEMDTVITWQ